jgi:hypothetical protein
MPIFGPPNIQKLKEEKNVKGLYKALKNNDKNVVREAGLALVEFGVYNSASLIYGVVDPDYEIRKTTYITFASLVHYGFIPLVTSLHDPHVSVRSASISAFLFRKDQRSIQVLGECLLSDPSSLVREIVVPVLVQIGGLKSYEYLSMAKKDPNIRVRNRIEDELSKANIFANAEASKSYNSRYSDDRFSIISIWEDLNRVLTSDHADNHRRYMTYSSPLGKSCKNWMEKAGNALRIGDEKTAYHYLWNIDNATQESLDSFHKYPNTDITDEMKKPFIEYNQASKLLITKLI